MRKLLLLTSLLFVSCFGANTPINNGVLTGNAVVPSGSTLTIQPGATITAAAGSTVNGFGGGAGNVSGNTTLFLNGPTNGTYTLPSNGTLVSTAFTGTTNITTLGTVTTGTMNATIGNATLINGSVITGNAEFQAAPAANLAAFNFSANPNITVQAIPPLGVPYVAAFIDGDTPYGGIANFAYGHSGGTFSGYRSEGTGASPIATYADHTLAGVYGGGFDGTNWAIGSYINFESYQDWTTSAHGTGFYWSTTPFDTLNTAEIMGGVTDGGDMFITPYAYPLDVSPNPYNIFRIQAAVNQGGSNQYSGILENITETSVGSVANLFLDLQLAGNRFWSVADTGQTVIGANTTANTFSQMLVVNGTANITGAATFGSTIIPMGNIAAPASLNLTSAGSSPINLVAAGNITANAVAGNVTIETGFGGTVLLDGSDGQILYGNTTFADAGFGIFLLGNPHATGNWTFAGATSFSNTGIFTGNVSTPALTLTAHELFATGNWTNGGNVDTLAASQYPLQIANSTWAGEGNIVTVGTVTTGTMNATIGNATLATGAVIGGNATFSGNVIFTDATTLKGTAILNGTADLNGTLNFSGATVTGFLPSFISQAGATSGQALAWNGSAYAPATIAGGGNVSANSTVALTVPPSQGDYTLPANSTLVGADNSPLGGEAPFWDGTAGNWSYQGTDSGGFKAFNYNSRQLYGTNTSTLLAWNTTTGVSLLGVPTAPNGTISGNDTAQLATFDSVIHYNVPAANVTAGAFANGMTATTQTVDDNSGNLATTALTANMWLDYGERQITTAKLTTAAGAGATATVESSDSILLSTGTTSANYAVAHDGNSYMGFSRGIASSGLGYMNFSEPSEMTCRLAQFSGSASGTWTITFNTSNTSAVLQSTDNGWGFAGSNYTVALVAANGTAISNTTVLTLAQNYDGDLHLKNYGNGTVAAWYNYGNGTITSPVTVTTGPTGVRVQASTAFYFGVFNNADAANTGLEIIMPRILWGQ